MACNRLSGHASHVSMSRSSLRSYAPFHPVTFRLQGGITLDCNMISRLNVKARHCHSGPIYELAFANGLFMSFGVFQGRGLEGT